MLIYPLRASASTAFIIYFSLSNLLVFAVNSDISIHLEIPLRLSAICAIL